uniref:Uncharacterized protein n=1 Tax=Populus trichocarpa TaxID=3694 RepID=B9NDU7_POPTR
MGINLLRDKASTVVNSIKYYSRALSLWRYILEAISQRNNTTHMPDALLIEKLDKNFARLMQKGVESDNRCVHCGAVGESLEHSQSGLFGIGETNRWSASRFTPAHIAIHPSLPKWEKPPPGFIKCNIDAAVDNNQEAMGLWEQC